MQPADTIKSTIEAMICPKHDIYPSVDIMGNEIQIACCCTAFHEICTQVAKQRLSDLNLQELILAE